MDVKKLMENLVFRGLSMGNRPLKVSAMILPEALRSVSLHQEKKQKHNVRVVEAVLQFLQSKGFG